MKNNKKFLKLCAAILAVASLFTLASCATNNTLTSTYAEIYKKIAACERNERAYAEDAVGTARKNTSVPTATYGADRTDYTGTNVQVTGIDESDSIKTDGRYIFIADQLTGEKIIKIVKADGADTELVSKITIPDEEVNYVVGMYVSGDTLAVITQKSSLYLESRKPEDNSDDTMANIMLYDISDVNAPKLITQSSQSGYYSDSRMKDGTIYMISSYSVWDPVEDKPETYIPKTCDTKNGTLLVPADCIIVPEKVESRRYTVISAFSMTSGEALSTMSILGGTDYLYMSDSHIFTTEQSYSEDVISEYKEDQYDVKEYNSKCETAIMSFSYSDGKIEQTAETSIPGCLINQFAMDEKDGYLRVVTTVEENSYKLYTDVNHGWDNYESGKRSQSTALYILDGNLGTVGSITGLAEGERVYSVRFYGDTGYFVTFKNIDPLFSVDLSDPKNPKILGELKIPGFSTYMQRYNDELLLGVGFDVTENGEFVRTTNVKLSMFDISDPKNVTEKSKLSFTETYSAAAYNHHAILADSGRNIIAFSAGETYYIFTYGDDGFVEKTSLKMQDDYLIRGIVIGDNIYVASLSGVIVMDTADFSQLAGVNLK